MSDNQTGRKDVEFTHSFVDPWASQSDATDGVEEVSLTYRFAKPTKAHIQRLQNAATKNAGQASRNLLIDVVHPDDKEALLAAMEEYAGIATSFSSAIIKGVGISAELGN
ncbi:MAG: hypothetical protein R3Y11_07575 [Pseudomonadota bacterium]